MLGLPTWALFLFLVGTSAILFGHALFLNEGFTAGQPGIPCGTDMPSCSLGTVCMNGFCHRPTKPSLPDNELPVYPKGSLNPSTL
jgi:hypothetical protein